MALQVLNNGETGLVIRDKINENFAEIYDLLDSAYTLVGDGVTDNTVAMQALIDAAKVTKGTIIIPPGWYKLGPLTITGADQGVNIIGQAWNSNLAESPEQGGVVFELISGSNDTLFTVDDDCAPCHWENIFFRGNQAGQTSGSSYCINFSDAVSPSRSGTFYRCRFERWRSGAVRVGTYRDAGKMDLCVFLTNGYDSGGSPVGGTGGDGITLAACNDWRFTRVDSGANSRNGMYIVGAGTVLGSQCNFFSNVKRGLQIDATAQLVTFSQGSFDRNLQEGLLIVGSDSVTKAHVRTFTDYLFAGNGVETDNTYSDIRITDDPNGFVQLVNPVFSRGGHANKNKYNIEVTGTTNSIVAVNPRYRTDAEAPYGTGFTNDQTLVVIQGLDQFGVPNGTAALPGLRFRGATNAGLYRTSGGNIGVSVGGALQAVFTSTGSAVNSVAMTGGVAGSPAVITASGEANAVLRLNAPGTGRVDVANILRLVAGTTARAQLQLVQGVAPTSPVDGDVWREDNTNTGLKVRINGVTKTVSVV